MGRVKTASGRSIPSMCDEPWVGPMHAATPTTRSVRRSTMYVCMAWGDNTTLDDRAST